MKEQIAKKILETVIAPMDEILHFPPSWDSPAARLALIAMGLQESGLTDRVQRNGGPAHGLWQFERGGGVAGVIRHETSKGWAEVVCLARNTECDPQSVWAALPYDDVLAAGFARLLLRTDPRPFPELSDEEGWWQYYLRNWRPGKPHRDRWTGNFKIAAGLV